MKQKTPLTELISTIDTLISVLPENALGAKNQLIIVKSKATELLPKEKEVIIESLKFYMNTDGIGNADGLAEVHFNETFTQK